jgi:NAD(P)-dependent dehydrogenase (short-subunit alcohol dehydrogenase family)
VRRVALIPGGARGIGRAIAHALAERDWDIAFCYRTSEDDAQIAVNAVEASGGAALALCADVSQPEACAELFDQVLAWRGHIDALVHCAGPFHRVDMLDDDRARLASHVREQPGQPVLPGPLGRARHDGATMGTHPGLQHGQRRSHHGAL